jgi:hypothetical protein
MVGLRWQRELIGPGWKDHAPARRKNLDRRGELGDLATAVIDAIVALWQAPITRTS